MNIQVICVGKIKESYLVECIAEYSKRLSRYCKLGITEVQDEKTPDKASDAEETKIKELEAERIRHFLRKDAYHIVLAIDGQMLDSVSFSDKLTAIGVGGKSCIQFIIGGSLGLPRELINSADMKLSFSKMTFPHQLMRCILLEQIYRAYRIQSNEPYHK